MKGRREWNRRTEKNSTGEPLFRAKPFAPHAFQTVLQPLDSIKAPIIFISPEAYQDMLALVDLSEMDEIGWLGTVAIIGRSQYLIEKIYLIGQQVDGGVSLLTIDDLNEFFTPFAQTHFEECGRMHFWGHYHSHNQTLPSSQDEEQMRLFGHNDFFIRGIVTRNGKIEFTFFDYKNRVRWEDVPWQIYVPPLHDQKKAEWGLEMRQKVKQFVPEIKPATAPSAPFGHFGKSIHPILSKGGGAHDQWP